MLHSRLLCLALYAATALANPAATPELIDIESVDVFVDTVDLNPTQQIIEVTVNRIDDLVDDGELVAERSSSIIFDFLLDESKKSLCMNNAVLDIYKAGPQRIETLAVIVPLAVSAEELGDELAELPTGLVTADVNIHADLSDDGSLLVTLVTDILELEGCELIASESVQSVIVIPASTLSAWGQPLEDNEQQKYTDADYFTCATSTNRFVSLSCKTIDWIVRGFVFCFVIAPLIGFGIGWLGMLALARAFGLLARRDQQYEELDTEESLGEGKPPAYNAECQAAEAADEKTALMNASD
ncbi:hypothetical protein NEOLI_000629 [Neolecta irregularis DAH-3]|uniref:Uncharacterized protein n=1 Tax=Neolecta irregularis (strain DAH-3) TaxID=1198029 RepID=A0A1U7LU69_NEOID|nr:hypothetical protein NEOLI_000629 [Neolecta irregularis DAH-3]|eukprot:OLL26123.1 hypothetical protein NEOLI_000629 [Neolecta irregularis DAH-3]